MMEEIVTAAVGFDADPDVGAILITGSEKAFAAGADIKQMADRGYADVRRRLVPPVGRPHPAAHPHGLGRSGFALGGGCEFAMMSDIIVAGEGAKFGQPEINLGRDSRYGGQSATDPCCGQGEGHGHGPHRPAHWCR